MGKNLDEFFDGDDNRLFRQFRKPRHKTPKHDLEGSVLKECRRWLTAQGYYSERRNTGAVQTDDTFFRFGTPGAADIFAVVRGQHIEIECKRRDGKGRLSDKQKEFRETMRRYGIPYFVVLSADDLQRQLQPLLLRMTR